MILKTVLTLIGILIAVPALAFTPQSGIWVIDSELTGKPGRGMQIEIQDGVLVFTYFGYKANGSPTFYLGSGPLANNSFQAILTEYGNGTALGGAFKDATEIGSAGTVSLAFTSSTKGTMTLPGEPEKSMSRGTFSDISRLLNRTFAGQAYGIGSFASDSTLFKFQVGSGVMKLQRVALFTGTCTFDGTYTTAGATLNAVGTYQCADASSGTFQATGITVDDNGLYTATFYRTPSTTSTAIREVHAGMP
jgi:hypothetical protein